MLSVFSLAGGVGKTCLVATLGRALAALGERVLLADTAAGGLLPFYFGSRESRPGAVRTFFPPGPALRAETDAPVQVLNLPGRALSRDSARIVTRGYGFVEWWPFDKSHPGGCRYG